MGGLILLIIGILIGMNWDSIKEVIGELINEIEKDLKE